MTTELIIIIGGSIVSVGGFIITAGVMIKGNQQGFKALEASNKNGFNMVDLKFNNLIQMLALEREGMKKDISCLDEECEGVKSQLKDEIYPRLNTVEKNIEKNCRAVIDHKELCNERHKKGA